MSDARSCEQLVEENSELKSLVSELLGRIVKFERAAARVAELEAVVAEQADEIAELERRLAADSTNSSRPPSSDVPWAKKPAKKRSLRTRSGRKPGKQPGTSSASRSLIDDPDKRVTIQPHCCRRCDVSLAGAAERGRQRRQIVDVQPPPPPKVTEYARVSKACRGCGTVTAPGWDSPEIPAEHAEILAAAGSPVRIGPETLARAALLACAHYRWFVGPGSMQVEGPTQLYLRFGSIQVTSTFALFAVL